MHWLSMSLVSLSTVSLHLHIHLPPLRPPFSLSISLSIAYTSLSISLSLYIPLSSLNATQPNPNEKKNSVLWWFTCVFSCFLFPMHLSTKSSKPFTLLDTRGFRAKVQGISAIFDNSIPKFLLFKRWCKAHKFPIDWKCLCGSFLN